MSKINSSLPPVGRIDELMWLVKEAKDNTIAFNKDGIGRTTYDFSQYSHDDIACLVRIAFILGMRLCITFREINQEAYFYFEISEEGKNETSNNRPV